MGPANNHVVIELRNVSKRFGANPVLRDVNLQLYGGQTTVCIGESGIGKSVLLRHIIGLLKPDQGEVYFHGQRIDTMGDKQLVEVHKHFGYLFQMGALFDSMTVGENVAFPLQEHTDYPRSRILEIVREKLRLVDLEGVESKKPAELSGGQRKRVALARAIALDPEVILYDEPTTGLDPIRAEGINELIVKIKRERGVTGVVVTHDLNSTYAVADRILMLHDGNFIIDGTPEQVRRSSDPRVRAFLQASGYKQNQAATHGQ
jgi:phospholipid/cholesterol/gamma-HCH transport system ATP-binding protein